MYTSHSYQSVQLQLRGDQSRRVLRISGSTSTATVDVGGNVVDLFTVLVHNLRSKDDKDTSAKISNAQKAMSNQQQ